MALDISSKADVVAAPRLFDDFYRDHSASIGHALQLTLGDPELAEDALNEAMARALQRWKKVRYYDNPAGWVYRVGLNWALSWLRRRRRERERPITFVTETAGIELHDEQLRVAIDQLSIEHRAVVVCRYFLDWSTSQTAELLEIAEGTVKSRLARALENIRTHLGDQDDY